MKISADEYPNLAAGLEHQKTRLKTMIDGELIGQELVQKGAMHAVQTLLRIGVTEENAKAMLESLSQYGQVISAECRRRGLPVVEHPSGN